MKGKISHRELEAVAGVWHPRLQGAPLDEFEEVLEVLHGVLLPLGAELLVPFAHKAAEQARGNASLNLVKVILRIGGEVLRALRIPAIRMKYTKINPLCPDRTNSSCIAKISILK